MFWAALAGPSVQQIVVRLAGGVQRPVRPLRGLDGDGRLEAIVFHGRRLTLVAVRKRDIIAGRDFSGEKQILPRIAAAVDAPQKSTRPFSIAAQLSGCRFRSRSVSIVS